MDTRGTLIYTDGDGEEQRTEVSGDLRMRTESGGDAQVEGVVHVEGEHIDGVREAMARQARDPEERPGARYSGAVHDEDGGEERVVTDLPMFVREAYVTGNVRLLSAGPVD